MKKLDEDTKRRVEETGSMIVGGRLVTPEKPKPKANKADEDKEKSDDDPKL